MRFHQVKMKRSIYALSTLALCMAMSTLVLPVLAYSGLGQGGITLEEHLELATRKVEYADANPATGSGTPYLDAGGVLGATLIAGAIFGGIATAFFVRGRSGRYAAYGRG
uniref:PDGLE domain-containing protein n=1 Tax=uncultured marine thaumarchaeote KM3_26_A01 TaxID=1456106 RepID=A0A075GYL9_9ARCH|nr:hypothetical protein [uncultured marine thaumarchaeote KM3_26_A01]